MYNGKKIIHIVSCGMNGEIGVDNSLLWNIPEELKYFKDGNQIKQELTPEQAHLWHMVTGISGEAL